MNGKGTCQVLYYQLKTVIFPTISTPFKFNTAETRNIKLQVTLKVSSGMKALGGLDISPLVSRGRVVLWSLCPLISSQNRTMSVIECPL